MITRQKKTVSVEKDVFIEKVCDFCSRKTQYEYSWTMGGYSYDEISISRLAGRVFPECDSRKKITIDMCPDCWCKKFVPWAISNGASFSVVDNDDGYPSDTPPDVEEKP